VQESVRREERLGRTEEKIREEGRNYLKRGTGRRLQMENRGDHRAL